ncbi:hypothetical protein [Novosphingobium sp. KACC 22771]|uniref:hypothetical protein n=1 Tax=Novosphingobium sp. KACC 22771 TaxID=3025670 RepID=UPI0023654F1A|nr:hypothetical protein [Novosphingobium sp. KACC 22771]WDF72302.1 hypothetical protein PQ467_16165 [Novosphingobium sp. KACC 22771]
MNWSGWANAARSYAGWVPNVGSHLSFSLIGVSSQSIVARRTCDHSEKDGSVGRMVCIVDKRHTDDFLLPAEIMRRLDPSVVQHFVMVAMTETVEVPTGFGEGPYQEENGFKVGKIVNTAPDEQGALVGRVHILPFYANSTLRQIQGWMIDDISRMTVMSAPASKLQQNALLADVEQLIRWRSPAAITVNFTLMRTGEVRLWYAQDYDDLKEADYVLAAKQAYFFIKDMAHRHIHHDSASDQITPLVKFEVLPEKPDKADTDWRRRTLWNLAREAERQAKFCRLDKQREALGILAFADAFQKTLLPYRRDPHDPSKFRANESVYGYDFGYIRESTKLRVEQMAAKRSAIAPLLSAMVAGAIAAPALVSSLVSTHNSATRDARTTSAHVSTQQSATLDSPSVIQLGFSERWLAFFAAHPWVASTITMAILFALYGYFLNDILGNTWKPWQRLRGMSISLSFKLAARSGRSANLTVNLFYPLLILIELFGFYTIMDTMLR